MKVKCELANRTSIRAFYVKNYLLIMAEGVLPTPGYSVDITELPMRIWPPQYSVLQCPKPGLWSDVLSPYKYFDLFRIGSRPDEITVHHEEGSDQVKVEDVLQGFEPLVVALGGDGATDGDQATRVLEEPHLRRGLRQSGRQPAAHPGSPSRLARDDHRHGQRSVVRRGRRVP